MEEKTQTFPYEWKLKDTLFTKDKGKVFSCFSCGGGSTMGYKLAGFDVIGCNEIDKKMMEVYKKNHNPKYSYLESIVDFKDRDDLPEELYNLDILDGSPPCSSFSIVGNRSKDWGKSKKFREGQSEQILDRLFFDYIDLAKKLQPKVVVAENVKGILQGDAIRYVREIYKELDDAGYYCQHFLLNASEMGIPQSRERVFFIGLRKDLAKDFLYQKDLFTQLPRIDIKFNEKEVPFNEIYEEGAKGELKISPSYGKFWELRKHGEADMSDTTLRTENVMKFFSVRYIYKEKVLPTITGAEKNMLFDEKRTLSKRELCLAGSYPLDYDFMSNKPSYLIGMSVPPVVMARISSEIYKQWLSKL